MNSLVKRAIHLLAGNTFNKIILFLFLPIFTSFLNPSEYAVYSNLLIFFSIAGMLYFLGLQQSLFSFFYKDPSKEYKFSLITSVFLILSCFGLLVSTLMIVFHNPLALFITRSTDNSYLINLMAVLLFVNMFFAISMSFLNIMEKSDVFIKITTAHNILFLLLLGLIAYLRKFTVFNIFLSQLVSITIFALIAVIYLSKYLRNLQISKPKYFDSHIINPMLKFGLVMIPASLALLMMRMSDRYMITYFDPNNLDSTGIYAVSYKFGTIIQLLLSIVSIIFFPYVLKIASFEQQKKVIRKLFDYYIWIGALVSAIVIYFTPELYALLVNGEYSYGAKITFVGVISTYLHGIFNIVNLAFYAKGKGSKIAITVIAGSLLNIVLNYFLILRYSILGAGIASILAYLFIVFYNISAVKQSYNLTFGLWKIFLVLISLAIISWLNFNSSFSLSHFFIKIIVSIIIGLGLIIYLYRSGKINEIKKIVRER